MRPRTMSPVRAIVMGAVFLAGLVAGVHGVYADTITANFIGVTGTGPYVWSYGISEDAGGRISGGAAPAASTLHTSTEGVVADYFTIYDFVGYTGVHAEPSGWTLQTLLVGSTDDALIVTDSATITNLTWYYTGSTLTGATTISGFSANSLYGAPNDNGGFSSEDTKNNPGGTNNGSTTRASGDITVPNPVPEPASLLLLGSGLTGLGVLARRRRAKKNQGQSA